MTKTLVAKNQVDKKATIFKKIQNGESFASIADWAEVQEDTIKTYYLPLYRKSMGINVTRKPRGTNVLKTIKAYVFDLLKVDSMDFIVINGLKFPIMGATQEELTYAGLEFGQVVVKSIDANEFSSNGYRLSK